MNFAKSNCSTVLRHTFIHLYNRTKVRIIDSDFYFFKRVIAFVQSHNMKRQDRMETMAHTNMSSRSMFFSFSVPKFSSSPLS